MTSDAIPSTLARPGAAPFWFAVLLTGAGTGVAAAALTRLLELVERAVWGGTGTNLLEAAQQAAAWRHVLILIGAGVVTGAGQILLRHLSSGNGIDTTAAIWFYAGRMPAWRTLGSAVLSVIIVGMGVSLGREGAPKQAGAVFANFFADRLRLSDEQRRLLVACGAGAGMSAAYGVPLGGALFSLEVMRGVLALRYVLPALFASLVATAVSWIALPDAPTYLIPSYASSTSCLVWALLAGPLAGLLSVGYVRVITWAYRSKPKGWHRLVRPSLGLGLLGVVSIWFPQLLGQRQGCFATRVYEPGGAGAAADFTAAEARHYRAVRQQRCAWRSVYANVNRRRLTRSCPGACLVLVLARRSSRIIRPAGCGSSSRRHYSRPHLHRGADDGADGPGPFLYPAHVARGGDRHPGGANHRTPLDLRCPFDR